MESKESSQPLRPHEMILQDRKMLELTGVSDVDSYDENTIIAYTSLGELTVHGRGLRIRHLDVEGGLLSLEGTVDAMSYAEVGRGGFLSRLLR